MKDDIGDEEDECDGRLENVQHGDLTIIIETDITESDIELKLFVHARNRSLAQIRTVHQADTIHDTACQDQAAVDFVDNLPLLSRGKLSVFGQGRVLRMGLIQVARFELLVARGLHGLDGTHSGGHDCAWAESVIVECREVEDSTEK